MFGPSNLVLPYQQSLNLVSTIYVEYTITSYIFFFWSVNIAIREFGFGDKALTQIISLSLRRLVYSKLAMFVYKKKMLFVSPQRYFLKDGFSYLIFCEL